MHLPRSLIISKSGIKVIRPEAAYLWRKVDHPGHDSCRIFRLAKGWRVIGAAIFQDPAGPCHLSYDVAADREWKTKSARVAGYIGRKTVDLHIQSARAGEWKINGILKKSVSGCVDVDLGFTPATNIIVLRRLRLKQGQAAEAPAAYLRFPQMRLVPPPSSIPPDRKQRILLRSPDRRVFRSSSCTACRSRKPVSRVI